MLPKINQMINPISTTQPQIVSPYTSNVNGDQNKPTQQLEGSTTINIIIISMHIIIM
jgi:hypothetical protein